MQSGIHGRRLLKIDFSERARRRLGIAVLWEGEQAGLHYMERPNPRLISCAHRRSDCPVAPELADGHEEHRQYPVDPKPTCGHAQEIADQRHPGEHQDWTAVLAYPFDPSQVSAYFFLKGFFVRQQSPN